MTQEEKEKLNEKIAKWLRMRVEHYSYNNQLFIGDKAVCNQQYFPSFTDSMDACIKWALPKIYRLGYVLEITSWSNYSEIKIYEPENNTMYGNLVTTVRQGKPLDATLVCLAVEKLMLWFV